MKKVVSTTKYLIFMMLIALSFVLYTKSSAVKAGVFTTNLGTTISAGL